MPPVAAALLILTPPQEILVKYKAVVIWTLQSCHGAQEWDIFGNGIGWECIQGQNVQYIKHGSCSV